MTLFIAFNGNTTPYLPRLVSVLFPEREKYLRAEDSPKLECEEERKVNSSDHVTMAQTYDIDILDDVLVLLQSDPDENENGSEINF